jgi:hypothetical protein
MLLSADALGLLIHKLLDLSSTNDHRRSHGQCQLLCRIAKFQTRARRDPRDLDIDSEVMVEVARSISMYDRACDFR